MHIAILGGGLTGLSSAFHLSRRFPNSLITLLEKQPSLGGWVRSERVEVRDAQGARHTVLLEAGPRTLRPNAKSVLELIHLLDLSSAVITTPKTSPAAKTRFLHLPDTPGLLPLPSSLLSLLSSPFRPLLLSAILREPFRAPNRSQGTTDESLDAFLTRRFGEPFARTFGSALVHGVYAADSRRLSVRAAFPVLWEAEERGLGSVVRGFMRPGRGGVQGEGGYELGESMAMMKGVSVYSFRDGMSTLTHTLERCLESNQNVRMLRGTEITSLQFNQDKTFQLTTTSGEPLNPSHIVSTLPLPTLQSILPPSAPLPHLTANPSSSVTVANLVFPGNPIHPAGFGYLIPRPAAGYHTPGNPGILGTVFDSCALSAQDTSEDPHAKSITKLTVMMGGPHPLTPAHTTLPSILQHLASHLSLPPSALPDPLFLRIHHHKDCIPTLTPGHLERMAELRAALHGGGPWDGRLEVIGAGVGGVSVGDCVEAGKRVGRTWI